MPDFQERTEEATPQKRQKAREKGNVPRSRELTSMLVSLIIFISLSFYGEKIILSFKIRMIDVFSNLDKRLILENLNSTFFEIVCCLFPLLIFSMFFGIVVSAAQGGFVIKNLEFELDKLNPINGFLKIFSSHNFFELLKSLLKFLVGGSVFYVVFRKIIPESFLFMKTDFNKLINIIFELLSKTTKYILIAFLIIAILDFFLQRWLFEKSLRMTKQEIRDEYKEQEGDPLLKSRIRSLQRELAQRRMMQEVSQATVVITNPTHLAVALKYTKELMAPKVVGKGTEFVAEKIKEVARKNNIPLVEDKPLARALYKLDIGEYIPKELYRAVAKILAFIFKGNNRNI